MKVEMRECSKCNKTKPVSSFRKTGKRCAACCREYEAEYREKNREKIRDTDAAWRRRQRVTRMHVALWGLEIALHKMADEGKLPASVLEKLTSSPD